MVDSVKSGKNNGYGPSTGSVEARKAVAKHVSVPGAEIRWDLVNVILKKICTSMISKINQMTIVLIAAKKESVMPYAR